MLACWDIVKKDGTTETEVDNCLATLITIINPHKNADNSGKVEAESEKFFNAFEIARNVDVLVEDALKELEA